jgi:hypothetical protein
LAQPSSFLKQVPLGSEFVIGLLCQQDQSMLTANGRKTLYVLRSCTYKMNVQKSLSLCFIFAECDKNRAGTSCSVRRQKA